MPFRMFATDPQTGYGLGYSTLEHNPDATAHFAEHLYGGNAQVNQDKASFAPETVDTPLNSRQVDSTLALKEDFDKSHDHHEDRPPERKSWMARKKFVIITCMLGVVLLIVIVLAAVLGTTLGRRNANTTPTSSTSDPASAATSVGPYPTTTSAGYTGIRSDSGLTATAVNVNHDSSSAWLYMVYYQDENNLIKESVYNTSSNTWTVNTVRYTSSTFGAKPGSNLAASASPGGDHGQVNIFYFDVNNMMHEVARTLDNSSSWDPGYTDGQNYTGHAESKLAAVWDNCPRCTGDLLSFWQDPSLNLRIANSSQLGMINAPIVTGLSPGAGFAVSAFGVANQPQNFQLFYATPQNVLSRINWSGANRVTNFVNTTGQGWSTYDVHSLGPVPSPNVSISSYTYTSFATFQPPQSMQVLNTGLSDGGANVTYWLSSDDGGTGKWEGSTTPDVFKAEIGPNSRIAATIARQVFAITKDGNIAQYTVADDGMSWKKVGLVPTK